MVNEIEILFVSLKGINSTYTRIKNDLWKGTIYKLYVLNYKVTIHDDEILYLILKLIGAKADLFQS